VAADELSDQSGQARATQELLTVARSSTSAGEEQRGESEASTGTSVQGRDKWDTWTRPLLIAFDRH
jgi:hypothetical protein